MLELVPIVDYLVLDDTPHLIAQECRACRARYFGRRSGCASCFGADFDTVDVATHGNLETFTIVSIAAEGITVPFVAGMVDCGGTLVPGNLINIEPTDSDIVLGMSLRLATYSIGADVAGTEAIAYGFEPISVRFEDGV